MWLEDPIECPFTLPDFPLELKAIRDYQTLVNNTFIILNDRKKRIERLLEDDGLIEGVEEDLRLARGKIMIISQKNLTKFDKLLKEARNDKQGVADLTGFWSLIVPELSDVQQACERVEKHRRNRGRLSLTASPRTPQKSALRSLIPAPTSISTKTENKQASKKPTPSRSTPGLRKFLATKRREVLSDHNSQV